MFYLLAAAAAVVLSALFLYRHHQRRARVYRNLARGRQRIVAGQAPGIAAAANPAALRPAFWHRRIARVEGFLDGVTLNQLQAECTANARRVERSHLPGHKKGGTLSYEAIHRHAPGCLALYHSPALQRWLSDLVGAPLQPTADHDQSACSILYYEQPGDHIGWHYDYNFYRGRHFTVLITLINRSRDGGASAGRLQHRVRGEVAEVATRENDLVVFEGARVLHRATRIGEGERRIMLSMTYCTDPRVSPAKELIRRLKDTAYFGPRVLFD
jgi:hypothetical protein